MATAVRTDRVTRATTRATASTLLSDCSSERPDADIENGEAQQSLSRWKAPPSGVSRAEG